MQIHISVRGLVEFLLRSGDIDNRHAAQGENAMLEGGRIHRQIQKSMGPEYSAEVPLSHIAWIGDHELIVEGRADGIMTREQGVTVDEIKGTYRDLERIKEPVPVHLAQAKCYAYIYALQQELSEITVRMTYCHLETEKLKYFEQAYSFKELAEWFDALLGEYRKWMDHAADWKAERDRSVKELAFPYPYREGQKDLVAYVYRTIYHKRKLFIEAPTGVGKTLSVLYPALKAVGEGRADRIFYLTAKTITRTVADDTLQLLEQGGLKAKRILLTAKEKICPQEETVCNPEACPYAKGHFDRINECLYDCLVHEDTYSRDVILAYAEKYRVCPFEMSLDMSLFADVIICDYNYAFDPHVYLKRFFAEGGTQQYLFLIDEAHNLVERGRDMYSARLCKEDFLALKRVIRDAAGGEKEAALYAITRLLDQCNKELLALKRECDAEYVTDPKLGAFTQVLMRLFDTIGKYLENTDSGAAPEREAILEFYFEISHFLMISELVDEHYVPYTQLAGDGSFQVVLFCVDPSKNLQECMGRAQSSILFSATLLPIWYYKKLLGATPQDYEVYVGSAFDPKKRGLFIADDVTSKYTRRGDQEYRKIAAYIRSITERRCGNYLIFFPSHQFLRSVYELFMESEYDPARMECIVQEGTMDEQAREMFLARFAEAADAGGAVTEKEAADAGGAVTEEEAADAGGARSEKCLLGFCVLGGLFGEGIDLKRDALIGAIIVGTGIPQVCTERAILKEYFDAQGGLGFDYAYRYPGMNKVLQAAGRVIRTAEDVGIVALLDYRFFQQEYRGMFPREWSGYEKVDLRSVAARIDRFWEEQLRQE